MTRPLRKKTRMRLGPWICGGLVCLTLAGCAELRGPAPSTRIPAALAAGSADPVRLAVDQAAEAFADAGRGLVNQPARTARAIAQVELLAVEFARDPRWAALPASARFETRAARTELRAAIGTRANADPDAVIRALADSLTALERNDTRAAADALNATLFEPGGNPTLARLAQPGSLPQTRNATGLVREEVERLQRSGLGGLSGALDPNANALTLAPGLGSLR